MTEAEVKMRAKKKKTQNQLKYNLCPQDAHSKGEKACKQKHTHQVFEVVFEKVCTEWLGHGRRRSRSHSKLKVQEGLHWDERQEMNPERRTLFLMCVVGVVEGVYWISERKRCKNCFLHGWRLAQRGKWFTWSSIDSAGGPQLRSFKVPKADFKIVFIYPVQKSGAEAACLHLIPKPRRSNLFHLHRDQLC